MESRLTSVVGTGVNVNYTYNGLDYRVGVSGTGGPRTFLRAGAYVTDAVLGDGQATYTPGISERRSGATRFLYSGLKSADSQSSTAQVVQAIRQYDAFGNVTGPTGTWNGRFGHAGGFGYQEDPTGLQLLGHRYYDPSTGRFLTRDPIQDGRNWFAYGGGRGAPTGLVDPDGLQTRDPRYRNDPYFNGGLRPGYLSSGQGKGRPPVVRHPGGSQVYMKGERPLGSANQVNLRGQGLQRGNELLKDAGLTPEINPKGGYIWRDRSGTIRARYDVDKKGSGHWHKYADDGKGDRVGSSLDDNGYIVDYKSGAAHISAGRSKGKLGIGKK